MCKLSSIKQSEFIKDITLSIKQISKVTQSNTATSEESVAAAEELSEQANNFYKSISDFKSNG